MFLDQLSVLVAIGFSSASLGMTFLMMWAIGRSETHLLIWATGLALIVAGVIVFSAVVENYSSGLLLTSFLFLIGGFGFLHAGCARFCTGQTNWVSTAVAVALALIPTSIAFALGYSGIGTMIGNIAIGALLMLIARHYWLARAESRLLMTANAICCVATAASFIACGYALAVQGQIILTSRPANWAEEINSIMAIAGLTGIGALSLTLNQMRIANRHKSDAMRDALTGLLNRRALFDGRMGIAPSGTAVVMMDLDYFKTINDRFGHDSGDRILMAFADVIHSNIRANDLAARMGGEEFCIIMPDAGPKASATVADRIRTQIEATTVQTENGPVRATVSAGIAVRSVEPETLQALLSRADAALYEAKASGRNRVQISGFSLAA
ncbi:MAG: diguanylate cyclase [Afipia sp.]|jgi:diguanylate cyclase (GGDEF)-like protein|nr:diguanylate cyclase [Afipia sp.]MBS4006553.1 diguanylate cyclase [Afipia sp.]WIG50047.1 MAG: diguanylate cyclase/phosphodiesterase (GGDEF & EAL domains) with PAS/PAC sensor(s) [Afipia sp.]